MWSIECVRRLVELGWSSWSIIRSFLLLDLLARSSRSKAATFTQKVGFLPTYMYPSAWGMIQTTALPYRSTSPSRITAR